MFPCFGVTNPTGDSGSLASQQATPNAKLGQDIVSAVGFPPTLRGCKSLLVHRTPLPG
jgi:hypothetical protein